MTPPPGIELLVESATLTLGLYRSLVIARWVAAPSAEAMRTMRLALTPFVERSHGFSAINVVDIRNVGTLADDARTEVAKTQRFFEVKQRALANVILGRGFWGATIRGVTASLAVLSGVRFPQRVFDDVEPAMGWLGPLTPDIGEAGVERAIVMVKSLDRVA